MSNAAVGAEVAVGGLPESYFHEIGLVSVPADIGFALDLGEVVGFLGLRSWRPAAATTQEPSRKSQSTPTSLMHADGWRPITRPAWPNPGPPPPGTICAVGSASSMCRSLARTVTLTTLPNWSPYATGGRRSAVDGRLTCAPRIACNSNAPYAFPAPRAHLA